ncbi:hypothetical protein VTL71DRAFT_12551 [Oculimacula yallundae]|uniref:Uncharacterized protein n=1 Tax=Oculimacula yallundae TaxID=86028 RepID=A0ABR4CPM0_9HELO
MNSYPEHTGDRSATGDESTDNGCVQTHISSIPNADLTTIAANQVVTVPTDETLPSINPADTEGQLFNNTLNDNENDSHQFSIIEEFFDAGLIAHSGEFDNRHWINEVIHGQWIEGFTFLTEAIDALKNIDTNLPPAELVLDYMHGIKAVVLMINICGMVATVDVDFNGGMIVYWTRVEA